MHQKILTPGRDITFNTLSKAFDKSELLKVIIYLWIFRLVRPGPYHVGGKDSEINANF